MLLIVEDGTMPEGANSYVGLDEAEAYLSARGLWDVTPSVDDGAGGQIPDAATVDKKTTVLIRAADALNILKWRGELPDWQRLLAWPRIRVLLPGSCTQFLPEGTIPPVVPRAQMELAALLYAGTSDPLAPVKYNGRITAVSESEKEGDLDVIGGDSKSYSLTFAGGVSAEAYLPSVYGLLAPWLAEIPGKSGGLSVGRMLRG